jgi:alpha-beta hydrolase superfamily lysophospholipase
MSKASYISLLLAGVMFGCGDDSASEKNNSVDNRLVSAELVSSIPLSDLKSLAQFSGQAGVTDLVRHGVSTYKIIYETSYKKRTIQASGLLFIPEDLAEPAPLISLQHGTTFVKKNAPSTGNTFTGMEYFAAAGYVAIMPDYIGYGASEEIFHPYYDRTHSAYTVIDMIKACKEFVQRENILINDQLFMAGYSEGGYVTLAATKELEDNPVHNLNVTAVAAGAGGYDLEDMLQSVISNRYYTYPSYLAFVLMAYNTTYDWNNPLSYFFQDKYAMTLDTLMNGTYEGWQINSRLTSEVKNLLNPNFLNGLKDPEGEALLKSALMENSVPGWKTNLPIRLYHGTRDEIIPHTNSELTLEKFRSMGSENITLTLINGGTHGSTFVPMLQQFIPWFESLRQ